MPARRHLEREDAADVIVVAHGVDHAQRPAEIAETDVAAVAPALLIKLDRLARVDRRHRDRPRAGVHATRRPEVLPDLEHAAARDDLEVLAAAALRDDRVPRALIEHADPAGRG